MALGIRQALERGFDNLTSEAGLNVLSALVVFNIAYGSVVASLRQQLVTVIRSGDREVVFAQPPLDFDILLLDLPISRFGRARPSDRISRRLTPRGAYQR